jgi:putative lipoprotein (rSAM/lipoprotein system)
MAKIKRVIIKHINWFLAAILSLLGFSGCKPEINNERYEYGTPYATFSFHGTVSDKRGMPVKSIKVEVTLAGDEYIEGETQTDERGQYSTQFRTFPVDEFQVIVSDVDGDLNGSYMNDTIPATINKTDYYEVGEGWNHGSADKEVNIILKDKQ